MKDADVRRAVLRQVHARYPEGPKNRILQEMGVWSGSVRIDIAVVNGKLLGWELKSERDTLERLPNQADIYSRVFDQLVLVAADKHIDCAAELVPHWWGLVAAKKRRDSVRLLSVRPATKNPSPDPYLIAQLLWKDEAIYLLERHGLANGWRSRRVRAIHEHLAAELPFKVLSAGVRNILRARENWLGHK